MGLFLVARCNKCGMDAWVCLTIQIIQINELLTHVSLWIVFLTIIGQYLLYHLPHRECEVKWMKNNNNQEWYSTCLTSTLDTLMTPTAIFSSAFHPCHNTTLYVSQSTTNFFTHGSANFSDTNGITIIGGVASSTLQIVSQTIGFSLFYEEHLWDKHIHLTNILLCKLLCAWHFHCQRKIYNAIFNILPHFI